MTIEEVRRSLSPAETALGVYVHSCGAAEWGWHKPAITAQLHDHSFLQSLATRLHQLLILPLPYSDKMPGYVHPSRLAQVPVDNPRDRDVKSDRKSSRYERDDSRERDDDGGHRNGRSSGKDRSRGDSRDVSPPPRHHDRDRSPIRSPRGRGDDDSDGEGRRTRNGDGRGGRASPKYEAYDEIERRIKRAEEEEAERRARARDRETPDRALESGRGRGGYGGGGGGYRGGGAGRVSGDFLES